jgi:hypothetical protein
VKLLPILFRLWIAAGGLTLVLSGIAVMVASTPLESLCRRRYCADPIIPLFGDAASKILYGSFLGGLGVLLIYDLVRDLAAWPRKLPKGADQLPMGKTE